MTVCRVMSCRHPFQRDTTLGIKVGFAENETFREKLRKFSSVFCKLAKFRIISGEWMKRKTRKRNEISRRNHANFAFLRFFFREDHGVEAVFCCFWWIFAFFISDFFNEMFAFFSWNFSISYSAKFCIFSRKRLKRNFAKRFFLIAANPRSKRARYDHIWAQDGIGRYWTKCIMYMFINRIREQVLYYWIE